jgi:N-acetylmuramoyl-L-alanine amidase
MAFRNIQVDVDNAVFQAALNRATSEGKAIGQVIADFLKQYADGATTGVPATYTVKSGDTLGKIAVKFYGDAHKYPIIQRANNITDPSRIWVGQTLVIPPIAGTTPTTSTAAPTPPVTTPSSPTVFIPAPTPTISSPTLPVTTPSSIPSAPSTIVPAPVAPAPTPTQAPPRPAIEWVGSPNFNRRPNPNDITAITIHATANTTLQGVIDWFNNPNAKVSAHYTIGKDGKIVQHVRDLDRAWHAGVSEWKGRPSCNDYCLGIELVNLNDGQDPYPEAQHQSNVALCAYLCYQYKISVDDIMGHYDIAPRRKTDPRNYDMDRLRREVAGILGR